MQEAEKKVKRAYTRSETSPRNRLSSINFQKSIAINIEHNDRTLKPNYLLDSKDFQYNRNSQEARALKKHIIAEAINTYSKRTGKKFQAKSYEWSAVVNLKPESTMQDLEELASHFNQKYGFQCYQIAIHRDEGHLNEKGEKVINHHAHLEFITLDRETGLNKWQRRHIGQNTLRQIQSEVAEILQMQRGQDKLISGVKRIEPRKYAQMKEQEKAEILSPAEIKKTLEVFRKHCIGKGLPKEFFRELSDKKKNAKEATKEELKLFFSALLRAYKTKDKELQEGNSKIHSLESDLKQKEQEFSEIANKLTERGQILEKKEKEIQDSQKELELKIDTFKEQKKAYNEKIKLLEQNNAEAFDSLQRSFRKRKSLVKNLLTFGNYNKNIQRDYEFAKSALQATSREAKENAQRELSKTQKELENTKKQLQNYEEEQKKSKAENEKLQQNYENILNLNKKYFKQIKEYETWLKTHLQDENLIQAFPQLAQEKKFKAQQKEQEKTKQQEQGLTRGG